MQFRWCTLLVAHAACAGRTEVPPRPAATQPPPPATPADCNQWVEAAHPTAAPESGTIAGVVRDLRTCGAASGVTVVLRSPALAEDRAVVADDHGRFVVDHLPAGTYRADMQYREASASRGEIVVRAGAVARVRLELDRASHGKPQH
jgi:hypothetical protein